MLWCADASGPFAVLRLLPAHTLFLVSVAADSAHIFCYEGGGIAMNSGVQARTLPGDSHGCISAAQVAAAINADDIHFPRTSLVCLENTTNRQGSALSLYFTCNYL